MLTDETERRALVSLAIGRIFRLGSRPEQPGDAAEYQRCRSIVLDNAGPCPVDHSPNYARDYGRGAINGGS
jgi:hypothetical protein